MSFKSVWATSMAFFKMSILSVAKVLGKLMASKWVKGILG